ncbi:MAG: signal peptide peptidase SppA [Prevotella sp.]
MKSFFKSVLATITGLIIFTVIVFIMSMISLAGMVASSSSKVSIKKNSVLVLNLSGTIEEQTKENILGQITGNTVNSLGLNQLLSGIQKAKDNDDIKGIYIEAGLLSSGYATLQEVRNALLDFKKSGKWIVAYGDEYTQGAYYVASVANKVLINPEGMLDWHGLAAQPMFIKDAVAKVGVKYNVIKVGKYKSATEMYTEDQMSDANKEQVDRFLNGTWQVLCQAIAKTRGIEVDSLNAYADRLIALESATQLLSYKLVDGLVYTDQIKPIINKLLGQEHTETINQVGLSDMQQVETSSNEKNEIAVYYAQGTITQNHAGGLFAQGSDIVSQTMCTDLEDLMNDDNVKAVVIRINSGGGDAYASEQIWHQVTELKAKKPVVISMGDYAASGAYYLSCNANWIMAQPTTLTGSIGIFGVIPDFSGLVNGKIGVKFDEIQTNKNSSFGNIFARPLSQDEVKYLTAKIQRGYSLFRKRVADGRRLSIEQVEEIAQGHVWLGADALKIRLVDQLGGLNEAIVKAAQLAKISNYTTNNYPAQGSWLDILKEEGGRNSYIDEQLRLTLGDLYEPLSMIRVVKQRQMMQAQLPYVLNIK